MKKWYNVNEKELESNNMHIVNPLEVQIAEGESFFDSYKIAPNSLSISDDEYYDEFELEGRRQLVRESW